MTNKTIVKVGKYEISHTNGTDFVALRNGEPWRNLTGDNLVMSLVERIEQLENLFCEPTPDMVHAGLSEAKRWLEDYADVQLSRGSSKDGNINPDEITEGDAHNLASFVIQAMAGKLPKDIE